MTIPLPKKKNAWPKQETIVVSENENFHMMVRQLIRSYHWKVQSTTNSIQQGLDCVKNGLADVMIIDDTRGLPALRMLRTLITDTVGLLTPVIYVTSEGEKNELTAIQNLGRPEIVQKPFTPSKFVPCFVNLLNVWETKPYVDLRAAAADFIAGNGAQGVKTLAPLLEHKEVSSFVAQVIASRYRVLGKFKEAESLLLKNLQRNPRNLSVIFNLVDLYNDAAMPHLARRFLSSAYASFGKASCLVPDLVQTTILLGKLDEAIDFMMPLFQKNTLDDQSLFFLARLLLAEGRELEAEQVLTGHRNRFKKMIELWQQAENVGMQEAGQPSQPSSSSSSSSASSTKDPTTPGEPGKPEESGQASQAS